MVKMVGLVLSNLDVLLYLYTFLVYLICHYVLHLRLAFLCRGIPNR